MGSAAAPGSMLLRRPKVIMLAMVWESPQVCACGLYLYTVKREGEKCVRPMAQSPGLLAGVTAVRVWLGMLAVNVGAHI